MNRFLILLYSILFSIFFSCEEENQIDSNYLYGEWQADSIYTFQNGFDMVKRGGNSWGTYEYLNSGKVSESKSGNKREFLFEIIGIDSMVYKKPDQTLMTSFKILKLTDHELVLKKNIQPIFKGTNQELYEIRYFSKL